MKVIIPLIVLIILAGAGVYYYQNYYNRYEADSWPDRPPAVEPLPKIEWPEYEGGKG